MCSTATLLELAMANDQQFLETLGERIRELRKAQGMTQEDLAERMDVTQALIASYESARRSIPLRKLCLLADIFGIPIQEVVGHTAPRRHKPGPASKLERRLEEIERLPRSEQKFVIRMLDNALAKAQ